MQEQVEVVRDSKMGIRGTVLEDDQGLGLWLSEVVIYTSGKEAISITAFSH